MLLKNKKKLVSIIIRTKNEEKWLEDCILSIYQQSYKNFEIVIVDNNSSDRTIDICKRHNLKVINVDCLTYAGNLGSLLSISNNPRYNFEQHCIKRYLWH